MRKFASCLLATTLAISPVLPKQLEAQELVTYVRRAEAAMILMKNAGIEVDKNATTGGIYPDIVDGDWYVPYMVKGLEMGLFEMEESTGLLSPHRSVSRAEFLKMMTIAFGLTTGIPHRYSDVPSASWYISYAGLSWRYGLFESEKQHHLDPSLKVTHQEAAKAIYTLLTAEPSLQLEPGMFPVRDFKPPKPLPIVEEKPKSLVTSITIYLKDTTEEAVEETSEAVEDVADTYIAFAPKTVKNAVLKLIQSRGSLAEQTRNEMIELLNIHRAQYKLAPLRSNYYLELSAQRHAKDMAERGYFSHYTPEGLSYVDRIKLGGYLDVGPDSCSCAQQFDIGGAQKKGPDHVITGNEQCSCEPIFSLGENLAKGQLSVRQVVNDWMDSPNHRKNILRPEFEEIGIGLFGDVWSQNFGRLKFE